MVKLPYKLGKMILIISKTNNVFYGAYVDNDFKGSLCVNKQGKISFTFVDKDYRNIGVGEAGARKTRKRFTINAKTIKTPTTSWLNTCT